jgi:hypothetical protein
MWLVGRCTFYAIVIVKNLKDDFIWRLILVYGSAYDEYKLDFISELNTIMAMW